MFIILFLKAKMKRYRVYLLAGHIVDYDRHDKTSDSPYTVRQAHQDGRISWGDIQMIDIVSGNSESAARYAKGQFYSRYVL